MTDRHVLSKTLNNTPVGNHEIIVTDGNGHGSTNTMIRRFTTTLVSVGTAITYADSATDGGSFTINTAGFYSIGYADGRSATAETIYGASLNSAQLTTSIDTITAANRLFSIRLATIDTWYTDGRVFRFVAGDVVRAHTNSTPNYTTNNNAVRFAIMKVSNG